MRVSRGASESRPAFLGHPSMILSVRLAATNPTKAIGYVARRFTPAALRVQKIYIFLLSHPPRMNRGWAQPCVHGVSTMKKICGSFYADWRDEHRRRHRKTFPTKKAAVRYQRRMQLAARSKKPQASRASARSRRPGSKASAPAAPPQK